ncbi:MAG: hypothetical protein NDI61_05750 [Bdellovibrionaceae bacterium]|nr:hypothetical protein [Pseudobdellovibrionaceae bacterium]
MNHWAHYRLPDARLKPLSEKRILKPFRLKPVSIQKLQEQVREGRFRSMTEALEAAIEKL